MGRRGFRPTRLLVGLLLATVGLVYVLDATGVLHPSEPLLWLLAPAGVLASGLLVVFGWLVGRVVSGQRDGKTGPGSASR
ncbi:hypothetical protein [Streptomyces sp. NPDC005438]|uniref:hypothetical protein n=1 Tax=Streptomyces sp. NPDC005438 TaxID=3156880 RepID=UPI0033AB72F0